jgi:anti-sigma B factor antagonist
VSISNERRRAGRGHGNGRHSFFAVQDVDANGRHTFVLTGELDMAQARELQEALQRVATDASAGITLDLSGLTFMGSTGLRIVLFARALCEQRGYEFRIIPGSANVQRVFALAGVSERLPFEQAL